MEKNQIPQKELENYLNIKGEIKGEILKGVLDYIKDRTGEEGSQKLQEEFKKIGLPIEQQKIKKSFWYPVGWHLIFLLIIQKLFHWADEDIFEMGKAVAKNPFFFNKIAAPPFISLDKKAAISSPKLWKGYSFEEERENNKFAEERKYYLVRIEDLKIHPIFCKFLEGYIAGLSIFLIKSQKINIKETSCPFKGDFYHEFTVWW